MGDYTINGCMNKSLISKQLVPALALVLTVRKAQKRQCLELTGPANTLHIQVCLIGRCLLCLFLISPDTETPLDIVHYRNQKVIRDRNQIVLPLHFTSHLGSCWGPFAEATHSTEIPR
jgi:hypothetical protein